LALAPLGAKGGDTDWYGYCVDDPVNRADAWGLKDEEASTRGKRIIAGGIKGAGTGALGGAVVGSPTGVGAPIGALVGGLIGFPVGLLKATIWEAVRERIATSPPKEESSGQDDPIEQRKTLGKWYGDR